MVSPPHLKERIDMTITLADVGSGFKRTAINTNFDAIEAAINNDLLDKAGGKALEADLDYNSKKAINMADGVVNTDGATVAQLNAAISGSASGLIASQIESQLGSAVSGLVTTFTGITYTIGANNLEVYRNGNRQTKTRDYTETSTSSITWIAAPNATDNLEFRTNTSTTTSVTTTAAITHVEDSTTYNLGTYLQNRHTVNVADFGAIADSDGTTGNGTDNSAAFAAAMVEAKATGKELYFPGANSLGTEAGYRTTSSLFAGEAVATRSQRGLKSIRGDGPENSIVYFETSGTPGLDMTGGRYTTVSEIQFYGVDSTSRPSVGVLAARVNVDVGSGVAPSGGEMVFTNVFIRGFYTTSAWYNYSAEWTRAINCTIENRYLLGKATVVTTDTNFLNVSASSGTTIAGDGGVTTNDQQSNIGHYFKNTIIFDYTTNPASSTANALANNYAAIKISGGRDVHFDECPVTLVVNDYGSVFELSEDANITGTSGADATNDSKPITGIQITNNFFHEVSATNTVVHIDGSNKDDTGMTLTDFNFYGNRGAGNGVTTTGYVALVADLGANSYTIDAKKVDFSSSSATSSNLSRFRDFSDITVDNLFDCSSFCEGSVRMRSASATFTIDVTKFTGTHQRLNAQSPAVQDITNAGAVDLINKVTQLTITTNSALTLADGYEGQEKELVMIANTASHIHTLTPTNLAGGTTVALNGVGETAILKFLSGNWNMMGGSATLA